MRPRPTADTEALLTRHDGQNGKNPRPVLPANQARPLDGLIAHLARIDAANSYPSGRLVDGCLIQPKRFANRSELMWDTAYLLFSLFYLKTGCCPQ